jgi:hypothetical protein
MQIKEPVPAYIVYNSQLTDLNCYWKQFTTYNEILLMFMKQQLKYIIGLSLAHLKS